MAKRFTETKIWDDDWWIELPDEYKLFWFYIKDHCDHAGIISPQVSKFQRLTNFRITQERAFELFNEGKRRIYILRDGKWLIVDFIQFQYGKKLNPKNRAHLSVIKIIDDLNLPKDIINYDIID